MNMRKTALSAGVIGSIGLSTASASFIPYDIMVTTAYQYGSPSDMVAGVPGNPETGFVRFENLGSSTIQGLFRVFGTANQGGDVDATFMGTLAQGQMFSISAGPESSNQGGFNGMNGLEISILGVASLNGQTSDINLSVFDKDIHSGVFRTNPFGLTLDNYVLEGGDPLLDTGDEFEPMQAPGHFEFVVPAPSTAMIVGFGMLAGVRRRRQSS